MRILQLSTFDKGGGAAKIAWNLFESYRAKGHDSCLAVGKKFSNNTNVFDLSTDIISKREEPFKNANTSAITGRGIVIKWLKNLSMMKVEWDKKAGRDSFYFPNSKGMLKMMYDSFDIMHAHNLHGNYFDLRILPWLSNQLPFILTLHDAWMVSGHCAHSFECEKWKTGCGDCPDLTIPPAIGRDATAYNWNQKKCIYSKSRLYIATPSRWLMNKVEQSILKPAVIDSRIIPNGVDLSVFYPVEKEKIRKELGIATNTSVLLFSAYGVRKNIWKDFDTLKNAITLIAGKLKGQHILFMVLGEEAPSEQIKDVTIKYIPYQKNSTFVAKYYQAADIYLHAAKADTFPNSIIESLACGTPVIATAVGGIPEQIKGLNIDARCQGDCEDGIKATGILTPPGNAHAMAKGIEVLLVHDTLRKQLSKNAAEDASERFSLRRQTNKYLAWFEEILAKNDDK